MEKRGMQINRKKKADVEISSLVWIIIAVVFLVLAVIVAIVLKKKGISAIEFLKNLIRFRK